MRNLSYANVMATVALFLALAGGTTAIALSGKNTVKSNDIAPGAVRSSDIADNGVRDSDRRDEGAGVFTARIAGFEQFNAECGPVNGVAADTSGCNALGGAPIQISPAVALQARDLAAKITTPGTDVGQTRTFSLLVNGDVTTLGCTIPVNLDTCTDSDAVVDISPNSELLIVEVPGNGAVPNTDAMVSFRLTKP